MTWTKLGDDYADRLEDLELTPTACWLHTAALIYCNRVGSDGRVPFSKLGKVAAIEEPALYVAELEQHGIWTRIEGEPAWQIDWTDQEPAEDVKRRRDGATLRQRRRRQHLAGDHSLCDPRRACHTVVTRDTADDGRTVPVTRDRTRESQSESRPPARPARPAPKGAGKGRGRTDQGDGIPKAADPEHCPHDEPFGMRVLGTGKNAARKCLACEAQHPIDELVSLATPRRSADPTTVSTTEERAS